jgi:hypothetical protein
MRKFNKANFLKEFKNRDNIMECACNLEEEETIEELVDTDGSMIDGSVPDGDEMNIQTGPVQKPSNDFSTFEKGMATTTDKARMATSQGNTWMRAFTGLGGTMYSHGMRGIGDWTSMIGSQGDDMEFGSVGMELEENMRDMVEAILDSSDDNKDIVKKKDDKDISDKVALDDLVSRIKELSPEEKEKLGKLLSDAK